MSCEEFINNPRALRIGLSEKQWNSTEKPDIVISIVPPFYVQVSNGTFGEFSVQIYPYITSVRVLGSSVPIFEVGKFTRQLERPFTLAVRSIDTPLSIAAGLTLQSSLRVDQKIGNTLLIQLVYYGLANQNPVDKKIYLTRYTFKRLQELCTPIHRIAQPEQAYVHGSLDLWIFPTRSTCAKCSESFIVQGSYNCPFAKNKPAFCGSCGEVIKNPNIED